MSNKHRRILLVSTLLAVHLLLVVLVYRPAGIGAEESAEPPQPDGLPGESVAQDEEPLAICRYGIATDKVDYSQLDWIADFGAGWFLDFSFDSPAATNGAEFMPLIWLQQNKDAQGNYLPSYYSIPQLDDEGLAKLLALYPGRTWIVGNEIDRGPTPGTTENGRQGDFFPHIYARAYHDIYYYIKDHDPTALVTVSGLVEVTPGRLQYLDLLWDAYLTQFGTEMPIDMWNMHLYILPEVNALGQPNDIASVAIGTDPALGIHDSGNNPALCPRDDVYCVAEHDDMDRFIEQIMAMRNWMRDHGQQDKPLILSEYSIIYPYSLSGQPCDFTDENGRCFDSERVATYMTETFSWLESAVDPELGYALDGNRLVQQWLWFGLRRPGLGHASNLISGDVSPQLTLAGQVFSTTVHSQTPTVNLIHDSPDQTVIAHIEASGTATATLTAAIRNNGNSRAPSEFQVTFYSDSELNNPIGSAVVAGPSENHYGLTGCATRYVTVSVQWPDLPAGTHPFWIAIDREQFVEESDETDNVATGQVIAIPPGAYLPIVLK